MALHPVTQTHARTEIDEICGQDQDPRTSQMDLLTYLPAVLKEVLRFAPVGNLGESNPFNTIHVLKIDHHGLCAFKPYHTS
jgi:hypothetical protein